MTPAQKSLPLAIGLNLVLPGAGYMYMGKVIVGIGALLFTVLLLAFAGVFLIVPAWIGINAIMAIDMWMLFNKREQAIAAATTRKCPYCAETIKTDAIICRFCNRSLSATA